MSPSYSLISLGVNRVLQMRLRVSFKSERMKWMHCYIASVFMLLLLCDCKDTDDSSLSEEAFSNLRILVSLL